MERDGPQTPPNSKGKEKENGKGRSTDVTFPASGGSEKEMQRGSRANLSSRVADSALTLGSGLVSGFDSAGHLLPSDKAGASIPRPQASKGETSSYAHQAGPSLGGNVKSTHAQEHVKQQEAAFSNFLDGTSVSQSLGVQHGLDLDERMGATAPQASRMLSHDDYASTDGLEVVKLLDTDYDEVVRPDPDVPLSRDDATALRRALFGNSAASSATGGRPADWDDLLNFVPEYVGDEASLRGTSELWQHMGTSDVSEARRTWANQWGDVLSRYTDEVWGDLGMLVQEAQAEARKIQEGGREATPAEAKAILRLRQILAHVRDG
ncbi:hypothetical protein JX265_009280 [Neoarthrinium moseri]|uniref:Uncharacterized protein n=1 Tax=Neoarthrinium moseri TaxID=1658444 RepID=A0A9P9WGR7_9PEZI|nr:uncharacterized protein JN550_013443 [Neoarthrinium moseri]KAI1857047.1 hypothetical protein JN550_013443 [Neoarthrinium moseri]KAI1862566.1 hypothetical protein JX265_009280 [Neoarthrinium moseri]